MASPPLEGAQCPSSCARRPLRDQKLMAVLLVDVADVTGSFLAARARPHRWQPDHSGRDQRLAARTSTRTCLLLVDSAQPPQHCGRTCLVRTGEGVEEAARAIMIERKGATPSCSVRPTSASPS